MKEPISSAGLVYLYLNGYEEDGTLLIRSIDTYRHLTEGFYRSVMESAEKADRVYRIVEAELKENFQRISAGKCIRKQSQELDGTGNAFFRCVQEFFCEQLNHFPKQAYYDCGDFIIGGICCSYLSDGSSNFVMDGIISLWMEREAPALCGQQLMTRSFFMCDFVGRKVIAVLPETTTDPWGLIFEGGHRIPADPEFPYSKETLHPDDLRGFCSSNAQSILLNPIYAYGQWFQPNDLCEEWHKAFLYFCAVSEHAWKQSDMDEVYERFLKFLQENICVTVDMPALISRKQFCSVLLVHLHRFREFLKGDDEPVISKDLHQTMNSRYVYLPYLLPLIPQMPAQFVFSVSALRELVDQATNEKDAYKKGIVWEDAAAYVLNRIEGWKITGRRIRAGSQEIDISIVNISLDDQLWQLGAYILVECKNWKSRVDLHQIRSIAHISGMKGNKTAILFASNGITEDAREEINRLAAENLSVICITAEELLQLQCAEDCKNLVIEKWKHLQERIDIASIL